MSSPDHPPQTPPTDPEATPAPSPEALKRPRPTGTSAARRTGGAKAAGRPEAPGTRTENLSLANPPAEQGVIEPRSDRSLPGVAGVDRPDPFQRGRRVWPD